LRTLRTLSVLGLVAAGTCAVSAKRLSVLSVSQRAMSAHSDESTCTFTETTRLWMP